MNEIQDMEENINPSYYLELFSWFRVNGTCDECCRRLLGSDLNGNLGKGGGYYALDKSTVCNTCLGLLQTSGTDKEFLEHVAQQISSSGYDFSEITVAVSIPLSLLVRDFVALKSLQEEYPQLSLLEKWRGLVSAKDRWRTLVNDDLHKLVQRNIKPQSSFVVTLNFDHEDSSIDLMFLNQFLSKPKFRRYRRPKSREIGLHDQHLSKPQIINALEKFTFSQLKSLTKCPPSSPTLPISLKCMEFFHSSIFLAGRYLKFSRKLSQTPWFVDGERRLDSSVEEIICDPIKLVVKASECRFSSSGREDIDVRCLGSGRPFLIECVNPKHGDISEKEVQDLCSHINGSTDDVRVEKVKRVLKCDASKLKEGEEQKKKTYSALCYIQGEVDMQRVKEVLDNQHQLTILQKTPIRVLHRRTLCVRERVIWWMKVREIVDAHHFILEMCTQAGTYVKEFVHGDLCRTQPNLCTLLDGDVDILELDVIDVDLVWPI